MKKISIVTLFLLFIPLSVSSVKAQTIFIPFNQNSIWNKPIGSNPQVEPNSTQMIQYLMSSFSTLYVDGISGPWSVPVYTSNASTPLQTICDIMNQHPCIRWPVPTSTIPTPDDDSKIALVDPILKRVFSGWRFTKNTIGTSDWTIDGGAFGWSDISQNGDGVHVWDGGNSGERVSTWNYYAGLFYPEEIKAGHIDHALHINIPASRAKKGYITGGFVWPALHSDGQSSDSNAIPVGTHFQLDPSINVDALNLSQGAKVIAKTLQKYGAWLGDTGSLTTINAREYVTGTLNNPTVDSSPWNDVLTANAFFNNFPMDKMRILVTNKADYYDETAPQNSPSSTPTTLPGDTNSDNKVDGRDYVIWLTNYNQEKVGSNFGDFNNDGIVNNSDYNIWLSTYKLNL